MEGKVDPIIEMLESEHGRCSNWLVPWHGVMMELSEKHPV